MAALRRVVPPPVQILLVGRLRWVFGRLPYRPRLLDRFSPLTRSLLDPYSISLLDLSPSLSPLLSPLGRLRIVSRPAALRTALYLQSMIMQQQYSLSSPSITDPIPLPCLTTNHHEIRPRRDCPQGPLVRHLLRDPAALLTPDLSCRSVSRVTQLFTAGLR